MFIPRATHEFATKYIRHNIINCKQYSFLLTAYIVFPLTLKTTLLEIMNHAVLFIVVIFVIL